jgi:hypothetical protein
MASKPSWAKSFSFTLDFERGMPGRILVTWEDSLRFLDNILRERKVQLYHVFVHWHPDPDLTHYCGVTYIDERRMAFCSGNDKSTMLHELAHLEYGLHEHDAKWAGKLIDLHQKYLTGKELEKADSDLVKDYKAAAKVMKRRKARTEASTPKRHRQRHRRGSKRRS